MPGDAMGNNTEQQSNPDIIYQFILFIVKGGKNSERAVDNLQALCNQWLPNRHNIKVIDVVKEFETALEYNIVLTPSVVLIDPEPQTIIYGDLSDSERFLNVLNIKRNLDGK